VNRYSTEEIRNVAVAGHGGSGKTSLVEAALYDSGAKDRLGRVEEGTTTSDFDPAEVKRHISISAALVPVIWQGKKINFLDTPGYADFQGEVRGAIRVADLALLVCPPEDHVEVGVEHAWEYATARGIARAFFVNRLDRENASFFTGLEALRCHYGNHVVPLQIPLGTEVNFKGVIDLITGKATVWENGKPTETEMPTEYQAQYEQWRENLVESAAENDDDLIAKFLEGEELTEDEIRKGVACGLKAGTLFPVLCGSATKNIGVHTLLDFIASCAPSPADAPLAEATTAKGNETEALEPNPSGPAALLVFKTTADPYVGKLTYFRVISGSIKSDSHLWDANREHDERIGQVYVLQGKKQDPVPELVAGDIGAVAKLQHTLTGDTLCDRTHSLVFPPIEFPEPIYSVAIHAKTKADEDKMGAALHRLEEQDPSFETHRDTANSQTIISGMGETHLDVLIENHKKLGAEVTVEEPRVAYRETIRAKATAQGRHKKQTGGRGQFGDCTITIEPLPHGEGYQFVDAIVGGAIPRQWIPAVDKGVQEAMARGILAGYPVVDVKCTVHDGSFHNVDSSELAFTLAGILAFQAAAEKANPVLLEPIMDLEVIVPEEMMGDVIGDLNTRRGRVQGMDTTGRGKQAIKAQVPQSEAMRYAIDLRSLTRGRGTFQMTFSHYEEVPQHAAQKVIEESQRRREEARAAH
jgi:elongation factor G